MSSPIKRGRDEDYKDLNKKYKESDEFIEPNECQLCGNKIENNEGFQHCKHATHSHKKCLKQWITRSENNKCLQCFQSYTNKNLTDIGIENSKEDEMRRQRLQRAFEEQRIARNQIEEERQREEHAAYKTFRERSINEFKTALIQVFQQINANNIENILARMIEMYQEFNLNFQLNNHEKTLLIKGFLNSNNRFISDYISNKPIKLIFNINNTNTNTVTFTRLETGSEERHTYEPIRVYARDALMPFSCLFENNNIRPADVLNIEFNGNVYDNNNILNEINDPPWSYGYYHPFIIFIRNFRGNYHDVFRNPPLIIYDQFADLLSKVLIGQATINSFVRLYNMQIYTLHVTLDSMSEPYIHPEQNNNNNSACSIMGGMQRRGSRRGSRRGFKKSRKNMHNNKSKFK